MTVLATSSPNGAVDHDGLESVGQGDQLIGVEIVEAVDDLVAHLGHLGRDLVQVVHERVHEVLAVTQAGIRFVTDQLDQLDSIFGLPDVVFLADADGVVDVLAAVDVDGHDSPMVFLYVLKKKLMKGTPQCRLSYSIRIDPFFSQLPIYLV